VYTRAESAHSLLNSNRSTLLAQDACDVASVCALDCIDPATSRRELEPRLAAAPYRLDCERSHRARERLAGRKPERGMRQVGLHGRTVEQLLQLDKCRVKDSSIRFAVLNHHARCVPWRRALGRWKGSQPHSNRPRRKT
jgi:hypothetical protein